MLHMFPVLLCFYCCCRMLFIILLHCKTCLLQESSPEVAVEFPLKYWWKGTEEFNQKCMWESSCVEIKGAILFVAFNAADMLAWSQEYSFLILFALDNNWWEPKKRSQDTAWSTLSPRFHNNSRTTWQSLNEFLELDFLWHWLPDEESERILRKGWSMFSKTLGSQVREFVKLIPILLVSTKILGDRL